MVEDVTAFIPEPTRKQLKAREARRVAGIATRKRRTAVLAARLAAAALAVCQHDSADGEAAQEHTRAVLEKRFRAILAPKSAEAARG